MSPNPLQYTSVFIPVHNLTAVIRAHQEKWHETTTTSSSTPSTIVSHNKTQTINVTFNQLTLLLFSIVTERDQAEELSKIQKHHTTSLYTRMNHFAIELNNNAVKELQSGRLCKSLETISLACRIIAEQHHEHTNVNPGEYKFHWTDCKHDAFETHSQKAKSANEPFLYLHFLRISAPHKKEHERNKEEFCPCGFAWAIWYK